MYVPSTAYRILLRNGTDFRQAADAVQYLKELGVGALSLSSPFHSIDMGEGGLATADPTKLDLQLGAESGFAQLDAELASAGLPLIVDINPNHMPASHENAWWFDVLEWGSKANHAGHFDVDWTEPLTLPMLERPLNEEVEAGRLHAVFDREYASLGLYHAERFYPFDPQTYESILAGIEGGLVTDLIAAASRATPSTTIRFHLDVQGAITNSIAADRVELASKLNDLSRDTKRIAAIIALQNWRLVEVKGASQAINYRHSANSRLAVGLRIEEPDVFDAFHKEPLSLLARTQIRGFRVNDIDELANPGAYTRQLRRVAGSDAFLVTDKILLAGQKTNDDWSVNGTAGYEFVSAVTDLFADHAGLSRLDLAHWSRLEPVGDNADYTHARSSLLHGSFQDDLKRLVQLLGDFQSPEISPAVRGRAIGDLVTALPVFRTYRSDGKISQFDLRIIRLAIEEISARPGQTSEENETLGLILHVMGSGKASADNEAAEAFVARFQQLTAALAALALRKSYRYTRAPIALDELMLNISEASAPVDRFHRMMVEKAAKEPSGLVATSQSYMTKFGEDARMRLLTLSEAPDRWAEAVERWRNRQAGNLAVIEDTVAPDQKTEWLIYQTLAAVWPASLLVHDTAGLALVRDDLATFLQQAIRESEKQSFWTGVNRPYGEAVMEYVDRLFADEPFLSDFAQTTKPFRVAGALNSFSQTVLKFTVPGVPVVHNGAETWDLSLSGALGSRQANFADLKSGLVNASLTPINILIEDWHSGGVKQRMVHSHLQLRQEKPELFLKGSYVPLDVVGRKADQIVAFYRQWKEEFVVVAVPRMCFGMVESFNSPFLPLPEWSQTYLKIPAALSRRHFRHLMTGHTVMLDGKFALSDAFREFPALTLVSAA